MVLVTGAGALHKSNTLGSLAVGRTDDLSLERTIGGCNTFKLHIGHTVLHASCTKVQQVLYGVGLPACSDHNGADLQLNLLFSIVKIEELVGSNLGPVFCSQSFDIQDVAAREGERS